MFTARLEIEQPVAYRLLKSGFDNNKLSHAYLLVGPKGTPCLETSLFIAQSLVCQDAIVFACEVCSICLRVKEKQYSDLIYLDGKVNSIKKEQIINLQQQFNKTALEQSDHKIYIIDQAENATTEALNSLLKFLEEPSSSQTTAILICEQEELLLPTIRSRCQIIKLHQNPTNILYQQCLNDGLDSLDSYLLSQLVKESNSIKEVVESDEYQSGLTLFKNFIETFPTNPDLALTNLHSNGFTSKNKTKDSLMFQYFIDFCILFFRSIVTYQEVRDSFWSKNVVVYSKENIAVDKLLTIALQSKDSLNRYINLALLIDQMVYKMKEVSKYERR